MLEETTVEEFRASLRGEALRDGDDGYDEAREVWNAMIDRRPALIARCAGAADVISAVNFARTNDLEVAVRGGGHNVAGNAVCEGGLMIDLTPMKSVRVDVAGRTARAEPGLTWGELNHETQAFGLATTGGVISHTGVAGLTLGGGLGWLMGQYGCTCDNVLSVDIVTADGQMLTASATENEDLFWAVRGGGGNFGVVTSFEFQLHEVGPLVFGGLVAYPMDQARDVLRFYRDFSRNAPDELTVNAALLTTPEGVPAVAMTIGWFGPLEEAEQQLAPLREMGTPMADMLGPIPYTILNSMLDDSAPFGVERYWKSGYFKHMEDEVLDIIIEHGSKMASPMSAVLFFHMHGAAARVPANATAYGLRDNQWDLDILAQWTDPADADRHIEWARAFWKAVEPYSVGVYVNHLDSDDAVRVKAAYGPNYERLLALKNQYDPTNFFHYNNNIKPTV